MKMAMDSLFGHRTEEEMNKSATLLSVHDLHCGYGKKEIVHGVSFEVERGQFACIIGANGCGKSTLLKHVLCLEKSFSGDIRMYGKSVVNMTEQERAKIFAYLPQAHTPPFPFTVADVVLMGRSPYLDRFSRVNDEDRQIAWDAMCLLGIQDLAERTYTKLSGGQRQLILIARCLAQQPDLIVMDEPTASLDFGNQQIVLSRMSELTKSGVSVLMVTHDPHHAFYCADHVIAMQDGRILDTGTPEEVMTEEMLHNIYNTDIEVMDVTLASGRTSKVVVPIRS